MPISDKDPSKELTYPRRCDGVCTLGEAAFEAVEGVLGFSCQGSKPFGTETVRVAKTADGRLIVDQMIPDMPESTRTCQNPRLAQKALQLTLSSQFDGIRVDSVYSR